MFISLLWVRKKKRILKVGVIIYRTFLIIGFCSQEHSKRVSTNQSVQSLSRVRLFATPWTAARQASLSITNSRSPPRLMSIESVMPSNHLILCHPLFLLPSIFPSIRVFYSESLLQLRWPKYWNYSFRISPSTEYSELISFRIDWFACSPRNTQESSPTK